MVSTMTTERRRNAHPGNCRSCGAAVEAGAGYLYRDTNGRQARARYDRTGRWGWFVRCNACHTGNKTKLTVEMERDAVRRQSAPVVRPWSVSQVRGWAVDRITHKGEPAILVESGTFGEIVSYRDRINSRFTAPTGYALKQMELAGRPLSEKAAAHLSALILALVVAVQREEQEAGEAALAKLLAAGASAKPCPSGYGWRVEFRGGRYTLWGCVGGKNKVMGITQPNESGRWVDTDAESLIGAV